MPTLGNGINDCLFVGKEPRSTSTPGIEIINSGGWSVVTRRVTRLRQEGTPTFVMILLRELPGVGASSSHPGEGNEARLASSLLAVVPHPPRPPHSREGNQRGVLRSPSLVRVDVGPCSERKIISIII